MSKRLAAFVLAAFILISVSGGVARADATAQIQAAQRQFNSGNYSGAISTLRGAATQNPQNAEVQYWLGRCYYELKDYDNAITAGEKSVALDPKNSIFHDWLRRIYG